MTGTGGLRHRRLLLGASAATAVLIGHLLDALGLLPGVHESAAVRSAALAPSYDVLTVVGAVAVAALAEAQLRRRRPWVAGAALLAGQGGLLALPEALGRAETTGHGEQWGALAAAVAVQLLLAAGAVGAAVVIDVLLLRLPRLLGFVPVPVCEVRRRRVAVPTTGRVVGGVRGRGPPVPVSP